MRVIDRHAERTGRKVMFAFNLTGEIDEMRRRHDLVGEPRRHVRDGEPEFGRGGGNDRARPPRSLAHSCAQERLGLFVAPPRARLVLCGLAENLAPRRRRSHARQRALPTSFGIRRKRDRIGASLSHADVRAKTVHRDAGLLLRPRPGRRRDLSALGSIDLIFAAGGGIMAHPGGPADGVASLREGLEAAVSGIPLDTMLATMLRSPRRSRPTLERGTKVPAGLLRRRFHRLDRRA